MLGMVATATRALLENLDRIPNEDQRSKVAIIGFDTSLYFFSIPVCYPVILPFWPRIDSGYSLERLSQVCLSSQM